MLSAYELPCFQVLPAKPHKRHDMNPSFQISKYSPFVIDCTADPMIHEPYSKQNMQIPTGNKWRIIQQRSDKKF
jgi:hypothetical protein